MIRFSELEIEDFGPYRGTYRIKFDAPSGVWVVYGANGLGKTSILNAFRFVLFGRIQGRLGEIPRSAMLNRVAAEANGISKYRVTLVFDVDGDSWEVTRSYEEGKSPGERLFVRIDGAVLPREQAEARLSGLMPLALGQFFLFDGEDLRLYEYLLDQESDAAEQLRGAIEEILGIPTLYRAAAALETINGEATRDIGEHLKRNEKTRLAGIKLTQAQELKDQYVSEREAEKARLARIRHELNEVEDALRRNRQSERIMVRLDVLRDQMEDVEEEKQLLLQRLMEVTPQLWKGILAEPARERLRAIEIQIEQAQQDADKAAFARQVTREMEENPNTCPVCQRSFVSSVKEAAEEWPQGRQPIDSAQLYALETKAKLLKRLVDRPEIDLIVERSRQVDGLTLKVHEMDQEIKEKEVALTESGAEEESLRSLTGRRDNLVGREQKAVSRLEEIEEDIKEQEHAIQSLRQKARDAEEEPDPSLDRLEKLSADLRQMFLKTADIYREEMREQVEQKATLVFKEVSAVAEYNRLVINDSYGLTILDNNGVPVPNRSAGYEHLVAFSLLAALQSFAPNSGPIVVDSPFIRLDAENTRRVIGSLPKIANQTLLLVFPGEFDRSAAVEALQGDLVQEFELKAERMGETSIEVRQ